MSRSQTDKRTHTAPHTRTPPPRLGRRERDERMEQPEGGDKNTYGREMWGDVGRCGYGLCACNRSPTRNSAFSAVWLLSSRRGEARD